MADQIASVQQLTSFMPSNTVGSRVARLGTEFIIVVFGVLAALGVDSWRESQEERELEAYYLQALESDLREDSSQLAFALNRLEAMRPLYLDSLMRGQGELVNDTAVFQIMRLGLGPALRITSATFGELLGSGSFGTIQDPALRSALRAYYGQSEAALRRIDARRPATDFEQVVTTEAFWVLDVLYRREFDASSAAAIDARPILEQMSGDLDGVSSYLRQRHLYVLFAKNALTYLRDTFLHPTLLAAREAQEP